MRKTLTTKATTTKPDDWKTAVSNGIAEIAQANERMEKRQVEIERLKVETRAILDALKAT